MRRIAVGIIVVACLFCGWFWLQTRPVDSSDAERVVVKIEKGSSVQDIAGELKDDRLIRSVYAFKLYAKMTGAQGSLQAGSFVMSRSLSLGGIIGSLQSGKTEEISITIPEGYTVAQIDALMAAKGLGKPGDILDCAFRCDFSTFDFLPAKNIGTVSDGIGSRLEGYLFPETYFVSTVDYVPKFFLERMLGTFRKRIVDGFAADIKTSGKSLADTITMASLVEGESRGDAERPVVAGILWKRMDSGITLGVDATIRYMLGKQRESLTETDLQTDSDYNTRKYQGLPPSPILSPSESAIRATLHPQETEFFYYLHDADGKIHYARTNEEHNGNRAKYLQ